MFTTLLDKKRFRSDIKLHVCQGNVQEAHARELKRERKRYSSKQSFKLDSDSTTRMTYIDSNPIEVTYFASIWS